MAFKMKGSPMQRNFGISPDNDVTEQQGGANTKKSRKIAEENKPDTNVKEFKYRTKLKTIKPTTDRRSKPVGPTPTSPPVMPKSHPVTPPEKNRVDTAKGITQFKSDINKVRSGRGVELVKNKVKNKVKKAYDYFTKK